MKQHSIILLLTLVLVSSWLREPALLQAEPVESLQHFSAEGRTARVFTTASDTDLRMTLTEELEFKPGSQPPETDIAVFVNPDARFQRFFGIGGAITDASAEVFAKLPEEGQRELLEAYFDPVEGLGYTLARTTIHSSDFSSASYTYIEDGDKNLTTFSIDHDRRYRIPLIKKAIEAAGGELTLYASPWSPPAFMKSNGDMLHGGRLLPDYYDAWARYYAKFIKAYEAEGIPIWGITVQNEPMATQTWESCIYTAEEERDFLKNHLGPILEQEGLGDKKIVVWDHNRDLIVHRTNTILSDPDAAKYVWGVGYHWYETWTGSEPMYDNLRLVGDTFPDKHLIFTESTAETFDPEHYEYWPNAEKYGMNMIEGFNSGTVGWTDWNILLDETGGPNHVGNFCSAAVHADTRTGELIFTPIYSYLGHFSRFIRPNAQRVSTSSSRSHLLSTSFVNEGGTMATVIMNPTEDQIRYRFFVGQYETEVSIPAHAIQTLVY